MNASRTVNLNEAATHHRRINAIRLRLGPLFIGLVLLSNLLLFAGGGSVYNPRTGQNYDSINQALEDSIPYDTVIVGPGSYRETVFIRNSLTLQGVREGGEWPRILPDEGRPAIVTLYPPPGSEIEIDGFEIMVSVSDEYAILAEHAQATLRNNRIIGTGEGMAIKTFMPASVTVDHNYIYNFKLGVRIENEQDRPVADVSIQNNTMDTIEEPITLTSCPDAVIAGNVITNPNNPSRYSRSAGVTLRDSPGAQILNNSICYHHLGIFVVNGDGTVIDGNSYSRDMSTLGTGIDIGGSSDITITANRVEDVYYGIVLNQAARAEVHQNWFEDADYGLQNGTLSPQYRVNARDNWWGASDGPSFMGPGSGVPVSQNVLFDPWLDDRPDLNDSKCR